MNEIFSKEHIRQYVKEEKTRIKKEIANIKWFELDTQIEVCIIQVGENESSNKYIAGKIKDCEEVGIKVHHIRLSSNITFSRFKKILNSIDNCAVIIQKPLPLHLEEKFASIIDHISPCYDIDGFRKDSLFSPCTPKGIIDYLEYCRIDLTGKNCVVLGRSNLVGKPLAKMLLDRHATVTICHSKTKNLSNITKQADILFVAIGQPKMITKEYVREDTMIIDIGINVDGDGKLCGDVDYNDVIEQCRYCTPVPCGVGLLTRLAFLRNVLDSCLINSD